MLSGLVCLSACVKDVESPSVTAVRDAKAKELASITALNNANATAAVTLANAEAALKAAEAKAKEAEAAKIAAETELVKVQAELAAVEVEIAKVKLEEEKVALEIKKAELEAKLVELEAIKADAEIAKTKAAADLERLSIELEAQLLRAKTDLLNAQRAYNQAAANIDNDGLLVLANAYFSASEALCEAQEALAQAKIGLSSAENGLVNIQEAKARLIIDDRNQIAQLQVLINAYKERQTASVEELQAEKLAAFENKLAAQTAKSKALDARVDAQDAYNEALDARFTTFRKNISKFSGIQEYVPVSYLSEGYKRIYSFYYTDAEGNTRSMPLYSSEYYDSEDVRYPKDDNAHIYSFFEKRTYIPLTADKEAYSKLVEQAKAVEGESYESDIEFPKKNAEAYTKNIERPHNCLATLEPVMKSYQEAYDAAGEALDKARQEELEAIDRVNEAYPISVYPEAVKQQEAWTAYTKALDKEDKARQKVQEAGTPEDAKRYVEFCEEQLAYAEADLSEAKKGVTAEAAEAVTKAQADVDAQQKAVDAKQTAYDKAYEAMRAARLADIANHSDATQAAYDKAVEALDKAGAELAEASSKMSELQGILITATDTYQSRLGNVEGYESAVGIWTARVASAKAGLDEATKAKDELEKAEKDRETAFQKYLEAEEDFNASIGDDSEYGTLYAEYRAKAEARIAAEENFNEASDDLNSADSRYSYSYTKSVLQTSKTLKEDYEKQIADRTEAHEAAVAAIAEAEKRFADAFAAEAEYTAAIEKVNTLNAAYEEAFAAWVDALIADSEASNTYEAIETLLNAETSLETEIANCESQIAALEAEIADVTAIESQERLIEHYKSTVSALEAKVKVLEAKVEAAKKALDEATSSQE